MATTFSAGQTAALENAVARMTETQAVELPFHESIIQEVGAVAVAVGFVATDGQWQELCKNNPISTLISFAAFIGEA